MNQMVKRFESPMNQLVKRFEIPIIIGLLAAGSLFLLKLAYLKNRVSTPVCIAYLWAVYEFVKLRYGVKIPFVLLLLVYLSVVLDGLGNLFQLYNGTFKYFQYDEFTHTAIPAMTVPVVVWLLREGLNHFGYRLPLGLVVFFALTTMFTLSGFYEVIELWDDKYMHPVPGMRIHGSYDTANDLQCDLIGMTLGSLLSYAWLKRRSQQPVQMADAISS